MAAANPSLHYDGGSSSSIRAGTPGANASTGNLQLLHAGNNLQALIDEMSTLVLDLKKINNFKSTNEFGNLGLQDFDSIRFATYRTACKLRFVQTKTNGWLTISGQILTST